jgi:DNA-binding response OmpR family regulator
MFKKIKTILAVDDDEDILKFLKKILEHNGFNVLTAQTALQALNIAKEKHPHLIVTDLVLDEVNPLEKSSLLQQKHTNEIDIKSGFDLLYSLKNEPSTKSIPTIVISAKSTPNYVYQAISLGAIDYIIKPINQSLLLRKIRKALQSSEFKQITFSEENKRFVQARIPANLSALSEYGFNFITTISLAPETQFQIKSQLFDSLNLNHLITQTTSRIAKSVETGMYYNFAKFVAIDGHSILRIRNLISKW